MKNQQPHWVRAKLRFNFYHSSTISRYPKRNVSWLQSRLVSHSWKIKLRVCCSDCVTQFPRDIFEIMDLLSEKYFIQGVLEERGGIELFGRYRIGTLWDGDWFTCRWCFCLWDWKKKPFGANGPEKNLSSVTNYKTVKTVFHHMSDNSITKRAKNRIDFVTFKC